MTKEEAYQAMLDGYKVRHKYYSDDEYVLLNKDANLQSEDGYEHGSEHDEFWALIQHWEDGWTVLPVQKGEPKYYGILQRYAEEMYELIRNEQELNPNTAFADIIVKIEREKLGLNKMK